MFLIKVTKKFPITDNQKSALIQTVQEADENAQCQVEGNCLEVSGSSSKLENLSYLLGVAVSGNSSNRILKLLMLYEESSNS